MPDEPGRLEPPDREVLLRAADGDADAFALIYHRYHPVVYRFGRSLTGCPTAAEDLAQETFVALFAHVKRYDPTRARFATYLYGILRNLMRERRRRERRFLSLDTLSTERGARSYIADPGVAMDKAAQAAHIRRALQRLPARYRDVIILCDCHGLSYADAARVVAGSTAAVRSRLHRGRQMLRQRLARFR